MIFDSIPLPRNRAWAARGICRMEHYETAGRFLLGLAPDGTMW